MPYWSHKEEIALIDMVEEGKPLEEIAEYFHRSTDALRMKIRRLGLEPPRARETAGNKVTTESTTTPAAPIGPKEMPSHKQALELLWGCVDRLKQLDLSPQDVKKTRLIISAVKAYIHLEADYFFRMKEVERRMLVMFKTEITHLQALADREEDPEKKAWFQEKVRGLEEEIQKMEELGVREPSSSKRPQWRRIA